MGAIMIKWALLSIAIVALTSAFGFSGSASGVAAAARLIFGSLVAAAVALCVVGFFLADMVG